MTTTTTTTTTATYDDAQGAERSRRIGRALRAIDAHYDELAGKARCLTARYHQTRRDPRSSPAAVARACAAQDAAWEQVREFDVPRDLLGRPIDPSPDGRRAWVVAFATVIGMPYMPPDEEDWPDEHLAGLHADRSRRSYAGDLMHCGACMDDEDWTIMWTSQLTIRARNGRPMTAAQAAWVRTHRTTS